MPHKEQESQNSHIPPFVSNGNARTASPSAGDVFRRVFTLMSRIKLGSTQTDPGMDQVMG